MYVCTVYSLRNLNTAVFLLLKTVKNHNTAGIHRGPNCFTEYTRYPNENIPKFKPFFLSKLWRFISVTS